MINSKETVLGWDRTITWKNCSHVRYLQACHEFQPCFVNPYLSDSFTFPGCSDEVITCLP